MARSPSRIANPRRAIMDRVERMPPRRTSAILGIAVPLIEIAPFEASAAAKLRLALRAVAAPLKESNGQFPVLLPE